MPSGFTLQRAARRGGLGVHLTSPVSSAFETEIIHLLGAHMMMLRVFDEHLDCAFSSSTEWQRLRDEIAVAVKPYTEFKAIR